MDGHLQISNLCTKLPFKELVTLLVTLDIKQLDQLHVQLVHYVL